MPPQAEGEMCGGGGKVRGLWELGQDGRPLGPRHRLLSPHYQARDAASLCLHGHSQDHHRLNISGYFSTTLLLIFPKTKVNPPKKAKVSPKILIFLQNVSQKTEELKTLMPGDMEGYVFAWDLANCLDPECGSEKLCLRSVRFFTW